MSDHVRIAGAILAGGQSRRMGENKAFLSFAGTTLITRAMNRLLPQVSQLILNVHGEGAAFERYGLPIVADASGDHQGPLAGMLASLRWAKSAGIARIVTVAVDTPFFPTDLVQRLIAAANGKSIAVASSGGRLHPVFGLWDAALAGELEHQISKGLRSARQWVELHEAGIAVWPIERYDPFFNINQPADMKKAVAILNEFSP